MKLNGRAGRTGTRDDLLLQHDETKGGSPWRHGLLPGKLLSESMSPRLLLSKPFHH